jgi:hypothetical protein
VQLKDIWTLLICQQHASKQTTSEYSFCEKDCIFIIYLIVLDVIKRNKKMKERHTVEREDQRVEVWKEVQSKL